MSGWATDRARVKARLVYKTLQLLYYAIVAFVNHNFPLYGRLYSELS